MNLLIYGIIGSASVLLFLIIFFIIILLRKTPATSETSTEEVRRCPTCGQILEPEWNRCPFCTDDVINFPQRKIEDKIKEEDKHWALLIINNNEKEEIYKMKKDIIYIGSGDYNDIRITDNKISPQHIKIWRNKENRFFIEDLNSQTGTKVNNRYIEEGEIKDGDTITIGNYNIIFKII